MAKTHCKRGHKLTAATVQIRKSRGYKIKTCKLCESYLARMRYRNKCLTK